MAPLYSGAHTQKSPRRALSRWSQTELVNNLLILERVRRIKYMRPPFARVC